MILWITIFHISETGGGGGVRRPRFFDHLTYVRVSSGHGQKKFDHVHGMNFNVIDHNHGQNPNFPWSKYTG